MWHWQGRNLVLRIYIQPGAKTTELAGLHNGRIKIRINAAPTEGEANRELTQFVSSLFKVSKSAISLDKGRTSRKKTLTIQNPDFLPAQFLALDS